jgi:hypothetical protein
MTEFDPGPPPEFAEILKWDEALGSIEAGKRVWPRSWPSESPSPKCWSR